jgi:hypothetical protein
LQILQVVPITGWDTITDITIPAIIITETTIIPTTINTTITGITIIGVTTAMGILRIIPRLPKAGGGLFLPQALSGSDSQQSDTK